MSAVLSDRELRASALAALAFFDMFDCPLTLAEIKRFLYDPSGRGASVPDLAGLASVLRQAPVETDEGYFFLSGRRTIVAARKRRYRLAEAKFIKARRLARWARLLPSVQLIAVCNSLALSNADRESDIDLFLVCRPGTVWITRLLIGGPLRLLGLMPDADDHADKYCLTFFLADDRLDIGSLALPAGDTYLHYWIASLTPMYDAGGVLDDFFAANAWVRRHLPQTYMTETSQQRAVPAVRYRGAWLLPLLRRLESLARRIQERRFPRAIAELANVDSRVVVSSAMLKFHVNDRRAQFQKTFQERLAGLGIVL